MRDIFNFFDKSKDPINFNAIRIGLAGPEKIRDWSHGEVKKPETINYRTFKPEKDGLFCSKIFGPIKDYECLCGKYKRMKHRGIVCEKCGVEVIHSKVRRERLGHITLATPIAHIWFFKSLPSKIGVLLDIRQKDLEKVIYCEAYIVIDAGTTLLKNGEILSEMQYRNLIEKYGEEAFLASIGAEAIRDLLREIEHGPQSDGNGLDFLSIQLRQELANTTSQIRNRKIVKRLKVIESFRSSDNKPEWMLLEVIPVIPPDLRPLVPLDGGRFATSDLNDLYRRVINRNNRLKRLQELSAPEIIIRNEKRMLQEAVDALFDNGRRGKLIINAGKRPLKSLSDMLKGKYGRFRQNLLGKRVDYSGRSVIVVGPSLKLHQCGIPKSMALELFKPFIYKKLSEKGYSNTIKSSRKLVEQEKDDVWNVLESITKEHPVILNRAPTLHRLGIQAFEPTLIEGRAIQLHPLVCAAFNADFDGDQMAVHIPLSIEAQLESRILMMSTNNILSPASGNPIIIPSQDMILGTYFMTRLRPFANGENTLFLSIKEVVSTYDLGFIDLQSMITCRIDKKVYRTTVGRILFYEKIPKNIYFEYINKIMGKPELTDLIDKCYRLNGQEITISLTDSLKDIGYTYATKSGISISMNDMLIPKEKYKLINQCELEIENITEQYIEGLITDSERYNNVIAIWSKVVEKVANEMMSVISKELFVDFYSKDNVLSGSFNSLYIMANSGARGSTPQLRQLAGMRGLMSKPSGDIIETPIIANFREGLSVLQYFISAHGARKGLADIALKTANSGYLTRRLVDVAQDSIVVEYDCKTTDGIDVNISLKKNIDSVSIKILGRVALDPILDKLTGFMIVEKNSEINEEALKVIKNIGIATIKIRSVLTCQTNHGVCAKCYGRDLSRGTLVNVGEAIGVIAAQSIGEPGTQLTMRTFHVGGIASGSTTDSYYKSKTQGTIHFQNLMVVKKHDGSLVAMSKRGFIYILDKNSIEVESYSLVYGATIFVKNNAKINVNELIAEWDPFSIPILTEISGKVSFKDLEEGETFSEQFDEYTGFSHKIVIESKKKKLKPYIVVTDENSCASQYAIPVGAIIIVVNNAYVHSGDILAKLNRETIKTKDITGGLPRIVELFEGRHPKNSAILSDINGIVYFNKDSKGKKKIIIHPKHGMIQEYSIPKDKNLCVRQGDFVKSGETLIDGVLDPHDILKIMGEEYLANYLISEIQSVYRLQGVHVNDKHIEIIIKQMLKRIIIKKTGNTTFLMDEYVEKKYFDIENLKICKMGGEKAIGEALLLGITEASLSTESFISSASFQETTRVLTESAVSNRIDHLRGLKENVIMGRLIPAGTGFPKYRNVIQNNIMKIYGENVSTNIDIPKNLFKIPQ
jgi:DNA-directed RNA polymerase subunit beta'